GLWPFVGKRCLGLGQEGRVVRKLDCRRAAMSVEFDRTIGWDAFLDEFLEGRADLGRILLMDKAERDLCRGFRRDDGLETLAGVATDDAVEFGGGSRPGQFQHRAAFFARWDRQADRAEEGLGRLAQRLP